MILTVDRVHFIGGSRDGDTKSVMNIVTSLPMTHKYDKMLYEVYRRQGTSNVFTLSWTIKDKS